MKQVPDQLKKLIPKRIEKGIYYRLYTLKDGSVRLIWWVKAWGKTGLPIYESSHSSRYEDAVKLKKKLISQVERGLRSGGNPDQVSIHELLDDWLDGGKAHPDTKKVYRYSVKANLLPEFGTLRAMKLTTERLKDYRKKRVAALVARRNPEDDDELDEATKAANVTVNREFSYLRAAFHYAMEEQTPPKVLQIPHFPMAPEDNARQGFLEDDGYERLRDSFSDVGVQLLFVVAFNVGVRSKELRLIRWNQVNFDEGVIDVLKTKNGKARVVPIFNGDMMEYLKAAKRQRDELYPDAPWVFSRVGEPIKDFRDAWEKACIAAGFCEERHGEKTATLLFHDLRRTAVRNMVRKHGLDRTIAKKISGHLTDSMFDRYNIIDVEDIKAAKKKVDDGSKRKGRTDGPSAPSTVHAELLEIANSLPAGDLQPILALLHSLNRNHRND